MAPTGFDWLLVVLSIVTFFVQVAAWLWVRDLSNRLDGQVGGELVGIISFMLGWTVGLRVVGLMGLIYFAVSGQTDPVVILSVFTQLIFLLIVCVVWYRLRPFTS